jgi:hypothetical protein
MGVVYKLKPEIKEFVLSKKKENPSLSCRKFVALVEEKFSRKISKSHINSLLKCSGLSSAVGRPALIKKKRMEKKGLGNIILEAVDSIIKKDFREVLFLKISFLGKRTFYLDAGPYTLWPTIYIPYDFSSTLYRLKNYIYRYYAGKEPFVFFTAPGHDAPSQDFLDFLKDWGNEENKLLAITLCGYKSEEIEKIPPLKRENCTFIFGLWPGQFEGYRKVNIKSEPRLYYSSPLKQAFYLYEGEIILFSPKTEKTTALRCCILKREKEAAPSLYICSNLNQITPEDMAAIYLNHWPNLEDGLRDYTHKIELFTYTATAREVHSLGCAELANESYQMALDLYIRSHFLPSQYENIDFLTTKERFYSLKGRLEKKKGYNCLYLLTPSGYRYPKDLSYLCNRLNEKGLIFEEKPILFRAG